MDHRTEHLADLALKLKRNIQQVNLIDNINDIVNYNTTLETVYNFIAFDRLAMHKKCFLLELLGETDSLRTRFCLFLANSLLKAGKTVVWYATIHLDYSLAQLELEYPEQLIVVHENLVENIETSMAELPLESHVFIDSLIGVKSDNKNYIDQPYFWFSRALGRVLNWKSLKVYMISSRSGFHFKSISKSFDRKIRYRLELKKIKFTKAFVGLNYTAVAGYYSLKFDDMQQIVYADFKKPIEASVLNFFWLVSKGVIKKEKRTYFYGKDRLGTDFKTILEKNAEKIETIIKRELAPAGVS